MEALDLLRVAVRWAHAMAAVAWVGGSLFYLLVLNPALIQFSRSERQALSARLAPHFQEVVRLSIVAFLLTGALLTVDRLTQPAADGGYAVVLGVKIVLSLWMFWIAWQLRRDPDLLPDEEPPARTWATHPNLVLALGLTVYLLAMVLKVLLEAAMLERMLLQ